MLPASLDGSAARRPAPTDGARVLSHGEQGWAPGYDPVEGRDGAIAQNDYKNVDAALADMFKAAQAKPKPKS